MPVDNHFQTANITDSIYATGEVAFSTAPFNRPYTQFSPALGGVTSGFHYGPDFSTYVPDMALVIRLPGGTWQMIGYILPSDPTKHDLISSTIYALHAGESAILHKTGSVLHVRNDGNMVMVPASKILLGSRTATAGVARIGDTVTVNVGGTNYSGTITSGSSTVLSS